MNEFSQAGKNATVLEQLESVASEHSHKVFNVGISDDYDHRLTYIHLGLVAKQ
ncbi:MAG: ribose 5-phosphate isomerase B [Alphaproteobacteria bacterium]|jgi:ribose 5-phosphate isomerase B